MDYHKIESDVFEMMNKVRAQPRCLIDDLQNMLHYFQGNTYKDPVSRINIITNEGQVAVNEAIGFLKNCQPAPPVTLSKGLTQASRDHAYDIGPKGDVSHTGSDGSTMSDRMERYGQWNRAIAENISFSEKTGKDIIMQFIIDDGNASRGHRKNLFNPDYLLVGVACGYHKGYEVCCVMDLAAEYDDELEKKTVGGKKSQDQNKPTLKKDDSDHDWNSRPNVVVSNNAHNQPQPTREPKDSYDRGFGGNDKKGCHEEVPFHEDEDWPENAVKCQIKKVTKKTGRFKIAKTIKCFTMRDGSMETHEYTTEELI